MKPKILVVDDEASHRRMLTVVLNAEGYETTEADDGETAVAAVEDRFYDLVLMDIRMAKMGGIEALREIRTLSPGIPVVIMTAYASVNTAVEALKSGAYDYLTKPIDIEELKILVKKALSHTALEKENRHLKERLDDRFDFSNILGRSPAMTSLLESVSMVAPSEATALLTGESGTGKELIANALHQNSPRRDGPFVKINCAALPETLLESELFGHEKGAFTGAVARKQGRFGAAHGGSIFLDEIGEMTPPLQAKLLRVLQEREYEPLGSGKTVKVDVRVIAATNIDLEAAIEEGRFRQDLYYRLNVVTLRMPSLRERRDDIPLLADHFLKIYADKNRRLIKGFSPRALDMMMRYDWPGNVRELENLVERAVILGRGDMITHEELPDVVKGADAAGAVQDGSATTPALPPARSLKEMEKEMILRTLDETGGNRTRAAEILGISRRTLQLKLKEYGVNP